jgi:nitrite reductase/ring-hydroxylating ferredoxin subunit
MARDDSSSPPTGGDGCDSCPAAAAGRRAFLLDAARMVVGALALTSLPSAAALAESVIATRPSSMRGTERTYTLPATDTISVDQDNDVILARWQNRVYAFSLRCPHRGTRLEWLTSERRIFCPKHKARFTPEGAHDSGRQSRDLDRYDITRRGSAIAVDLAALRRADQDPVAWRAAVIVLP